MLVGSCMEAGFYVHGGYVCGRSVHVASLVCAGHCVPVESPVHRCVQRTPCSQGLLRVSVGMPVGSNYVEGARCRDRSGRGLVWGGVHTCGNEGPLGAVLFLYVCGVGVCRGSAVRVPVCPGGSQVLMGVRVCGRLCAGVGVGDVRVWCGAPVLTGPQALPCPGLGTAPTVSPAPPAFRSQ